MNNKLVILFFPRVNTDKTRFMPYSVLYLERMIRDIGVEIMLIDEQITPDYEPVIEKNKDRIFAGALTAATGFQLKGAITFSKIIKKLNKNTYTIWTGWHTSLLPEITLNETWVDFVISGQAELPFLKLTEALLGQSDYKNIEGLGYKIDGKLIINSKCKFTDIKLFPDVNYTLINPEDYIFENSFSKRCITYFASHGCPFSCDFCSLATVFGGKWYPKDVAQIIKDLRFLKEKAKLDAVSFWDDNFFTSKNFSLELTKALIANKLDLKWECCTHAGLFNKLFTDEDIALFYSSGLRQMFIGAESGDDEVLQKVHKQININDNYLIAKTLKTHKISPVFLLIACFPMSPDKDLTATLNMVRKAKLINRRLKIRLHLFVPVPGTTMHEEALKNKLRMPEKLEDYVYFMYHFKPPWIKKDYRWQLETFVNFYLPLANPFLFREAPTLPFKILTALLSFIFFPFVELRFRLNFFAFPIGAYVFLGLLHLFNRLTGKKLSLGTESYLDKNALGFYNSYCG